MPAGAASAARTDSANGFLQNESAALLHFRLVRSLHIVLGEKIDCRLAELGELLPQGRCLCCGYPSAADICPCCQGGCWPPFNSFFRCELQARLAWLGLEAKRLELDQLRALQRAQSALGKGEGIAQALEELNRQRNRPFAPDLFPGDRRQTTVTPAPSRNGFEALRQRVDLSDYAGGFTRLSQVGPDRWRGKCPLHQERTGSFYVYADPWRWRCFGACAQGGDIVALARELRRAGKW